MSDKRKFTILILAVCLLAVGGLLYFLLGRKERGVQAPEEENQMMYQKYSDLTIDFSFEYPEAWEIEEKYVTEGEAVSVQQVIISSAEGFTVGLLSHKEEKLSEGTSPCEKYKDCVPNESQPEPAADYSQDNLISFATLDDQEIYLIESVFTETEQSYFLLEKIEGEVTDKLTVLGHDGEYDYFQISYMFETQEAVDNWERLRPVLRRVVASLEIE